MPKEAPTAEDLGYTQNNEQLLKNEYARDKREASSGAFGPKFFLPQGGNSMVRVLPAHANSNGAFFHRIEEHAAHDNGHFSPAFCPRQVKEPCPFCEEKERLQAEGSETFLELSREFRAQQKFLFNVVVLSTEKGGTGIEDGVQVLKSGVKVKRQILDLDQDHSGGWGDVTNIENGHNLVINRRGTTRNDTEYFVKGVPTRTSILDQFKTAGIPFDKLAPHDLTSYSERKTYEELEGLLMEKKSTLNMQSAPTEKASESGAGTDDIPF